jgi:hypothetical protein
LNDEELSDGFHHAKETSSEDKEVSKMLANRLPASLEALHVDMLSHKSDLEAVVDMIQASRTSLPNLKQLHISHLRGQSLEDMKGFSETLCERGIAYDERGDQAYRNESFKVLSKLLIGQGEN